MHTGGQARVPEGIIPAFTRRLPDLLFDTKLIESGMAGNERGGTVGALMEAESSKFQGDRA